MNEKVFGDKEHFQVENVDFAEKLGSLLAGHDAHNPTALKS